MTDDDLDFDLPPRGRIGVEPRRRRGGRWGAARKPPKLLTMVPPSVRAAARRKLEAVNGVRLSGRSGLQAIARAIAVVLALPVPKDFGEATRLVLGFVERKNGAVVYPLPAARPFIPLRIGLAMERALARTREAREVGSTSDGSLSPKRIITE